MKILHYCLTVTYVILVLIFTFHGENSHDAFATCITINGTEECSTPPPIITSIQSYYTPNETIHLVGVFRPNSMIQVDLVDPDNDVKNSVLFQSDSSGSFQSQFVVPDDAVNGTWKINISSGITHSSRYIIVISKNLQQNAFDKNSVSYTNSICNDNMPPIQTLKPASVNSSSPKLGILAMQPNSVATICMKYVRLFHGNPSFEINNTQLIPSVGIENIQVHGSQISFGSIPVNNVIAKAQQKIISFGSQENASTVVLYTLSAKPDSVGYYHVGIPYMCGNIQLAVGFSESQIDASAFQDVTPMCFNYGVETSIIGIQGANMTYVDISNKTIHSTKLPENISIIPPLQQMRIYDDARFIRCNSDLQLIFKYENGSPACVTPDTANKLIALGWGSKVFSHTESVRPFDTLKMNVIGTDLSFTYTILGGQLENATANIQNQSLDLSLKTTGNGSLTAILPRGLIDSQIHGQDTPFIIIEDGREVKYKQIDSTITDRTLSIPFQYGTSTIEIIAPESIR